MASPQRSSRPRTKTASSACIPQTSRATHVFEIAGHSLHRGLGAYRFIRSASFHVGGYEWCIRYYPDGAGVEGYVGVFIELLTNNAEVRVQYDFRLVDHTTGSSVSVFYLAARLPMNTVDRITHSSYASGAPCFVHRSELEGSTYLRDDRLVIECDLTVIIKEAIVVEATARATNDLSQDLGSLLDTKEGADVSFKVEGEVFSAHSVVLATRSSVFKAEFYGPLRAQRDEHITIEDIQPDVFRALLHFIYTDSMPPSMSDLDADQKKQLIQHLLVAADRYDVQRLKAACERALCESLDVQTVAAMLA